MWNVNFLSTALDVGVDRQFNKVVAQAVAEALCQYVCGVKSILVRCHDVVIQFYWEGYAQSGQFFHSLFLIFFCFCCIQSDWCFAVFFWQAHFFSYQFNVISTIRSVAQTLHGVEVIFTSQWVNCISSLPVVGQIQTVVHCFTECFVSDSSVPVSIWCAVFILLVEVEVELIGVFGWSCWNQIVIELVVWIRSDGAQLRFAQTDCIDFAGFVQLITNIRRLNHFVSNSIKTCALSIPVHWVFGKYLFITLDIGCHGVASVVPQVFVVNRFVTIWTAQFIDHCLIYWIQTVICAQRVKVWFWSYTLINNCVSIWCFHTNHF